MLRIINITFENIICEYITVEINVIIITSTGVNVRLRLKLCKFLSNFDKVTNCLLKVLKFCQY